MNIPAYDNIPVGEHSVHSLDPNDPMPQQQFQMTNLYKKAATHFTVTNSVLLLYAIMKVACGVSILYLIPIYTGCGYADWWIHTKSSMLNQWIALMCVHGLLMIILNFSQVKWITNENNKLNVALRLDELHLVGQHQEVVFPSLMEESRRIGILAKQIKVEVQKETCCGKCIGRVLFLAFQCLVFWGFNIFFQLYKDQTGCQQYGFILLSFILVLSLYQHIDFYIVLILAILCSPFLLIFAIYYLINLCVKQKERVETMQRLNAKDYKPNSVQGDPMCTICYSPYELGQKVVTLKCSLSHHFHDECISDWLNISKTCPLCRAQV